MREKLGTKNISLKLKTCHDAILKNMFVILFPQQNLRYFSCRGDEQRKTKIFTHSKLNIFLRSCSILTRIVFKGKNILKIKLKKSNFESYLVYK